MIQIDDVRQLAVIVRQNHNHAIDIINQKFVANSQRGAVKDLSSKTFLEIWPTACSVKYYGDNASLLNVITVNRITYEKFKEKDENGYYGKYHFKQHNTIPYSEALMKNKGKAPKLNSAPIKKNNSK
jgi:hypothetical protein